MICRTNLIIDCCNLNNRQVGLNKERLFWLLVGDSLNEAITVITSWINRSMPFLIRDRYVENAIQYPCLASEPFSQQTAERKIGRWTCCPDGLWVVAVPLRSDQQMAVLVSIRWVSNCWTRQVAFHKFTCRCAVSTHAAVSSWTSLGTTWSRYHRIWSSNPGALANLDDFAVSCSLYVERGYRHGQRSSRGLRARGRTVWEIVGGILRLQSLLGRTIET